MSLFENFKKNGTNVLNKADAYIKEQQRKIEEHNKLEEQRKTQLMQDYQKLVNEYKDKCLINVEKAEFKDLKNDKQKLKDIINAFISNNESVQTKIGKVILNKKIEFNFNSNWACEGQIENSLIMNIHNDKHINKIFEAVNIIMYNTLIAITGIMTEMRHCTSTFKYNKKDDMLQVSFSIKRNKYKPVKQHNSEQNEPNNRNSYSYIIFWS